MLYALFFAIAIAYNWWKFSKEREDLLSSLIEAKSLTHREMILGHHFYVFIFECFLGFIAAHFIIERARTGLERGRTGWERARPALVYARTGLVCLCSKLVS